jgi:hypothetical protein
MLTLNVTNRIIMKITVWLIPTRQRFDNCLLKKFNYRYCREQKKLVVKIHIQNHTLTQWKMLHCKTVVNIIIYHHVV